MPKIATKYFWTTLGCLLMAVAINSFAVRHHFVAGGIAGFSMILYYLFHWPAGITSFFFNIPLFYMAYRYMSRTFCIDSLIGTLIFSVLLDSTVFLQQVVQVNDPILCCIAAGVMEGLGAAMVYRSDTSTGGVDIIGFMAKKYKNISISTTNLANVIVKYKIKKYRLQLSEKRRKNRTHSSCGFKKILYNERWTLDLL